MVLPITRIITNQVRRGQRFNPLPSAARASVSKMDYVERFAAEVKPKVLSNTAPIIVASAAFDPAAPAELIQVLQLTLPIPMPIGLTLGAYKPTNDRFREAARFSAIVTVPGGADPRPQGRYIIEWGVGEARNYAYTDLAPGALQIPVAQSLTVYAHLFSNLPGGLVPGDLGAFAGASAYPGDVVEGPEASFSHVVRRFVGGGTISGVHTVPPFSRDLSAAVIGDQPNTAKLVVLVSDAGGSAVGTWVLPAPESGIAFTTVPVTQPQRLSRDPLPGGADLVGLVASGLLAGGGGYTVETIRL